MLDDLIRRQRLQALAGSTTFERGETYFRDGRVEVVADEDDELAGSVEGGERYGVRLRAERGGLRWSCTCPAGERGKFCKHAVALALTRFAEDGGHPAAEGESGDEHSEEPPAAEPAQKKKRGGTEAKLRAFLEAQDDVRLVDWLLEAARSDRALRERLLLAATAGSGAAALRKVVTQVTRTHGFVDYYEMPAYAQRVDEMIDGLERLLDTGHAAELIDLCEYAVDRLEEALQSCDDSDGSMGELLARLRRLHLRACEEAKPDPVALARRLFGRETTEEWDTFIDIVDDYGPVLGEAGLAEYERLARAQWDKLPALKPGDQSRDPSGARFAITRIMERLAARSGDPLALVEVKKKDLSGPHHFLNIAEIFREAGRHDDALSWAEQGAAEFKGSPDWRLEDFLVEEYARRERWEDSMNLAWTQFARWPDAEGYKKLVGRARRAKSVERWRTKALEALRGTIAEAHGRVQAASRGRTTFADHTALVEIFLWEKDLDAALAEAQSGSVQIPSLLKLAESLTPTRPLEAVVLYQRAVEPIIEQKKNDAYQQAAAIIGTVEAILKAHDKAQEFGAWLGRVRLAHKPKRNFMKLLDGL